jgi:hypothetical protein
VAVDFNDSGSINAAENAMGRFNCSRTRASRVRAEICRFSHASRRLTNPGLSCSQSVGIGRECPAKQGANHGIRPSRTGTQPSCSRWPQSRSSLRQFVLLGADTEAPRRLFKRGNGRCLWDLRHSAAALPCRRSERGSVWGHHGTDVLADHRRPLPNSRHAEHRVSLQDRGAPGWRSSVPNGNSSGKWRFALLK